MRNTDRLLRSMSKIILVLFLLLLLGVILQMTARKSLLRAIEESQYSRLEKLCSIPLIHLESSMVQDFLDAIFERPQNSFPLEYACEKGDIQATNILLGNGANPNESHHFGGNGYSCLDIAIINGNTALVELLLQYGAKTSTQSRALGNSLINWKNSENNSNKHNLQSFSTILQLLHENDLLSNQQIDFAIQASALTGNIEIAQYLDSICDDFLKQRNEQGQTLLHIACISGYTDENEKNRFVEKLIAMGIDVSLQDENGKTAYDYAIKYGHTELAQLVKP